MQKELIFVQHVEQSSGNGLCKSKREGREATETCRNWVMLLPLEPKQQWVRTASHFPHGWQEGSLESAGYSSELLLIVEVLSKVHLEENLCGETALNYREMLNKFDTKLSILVCSA